MKDYSPERSFSPKIIVNQVESRKMGMQVVEKLKATAERYFSNEDAFKLDVGFLGFIPYDRVIFRDSERKRSPYTTVYPDCAASKCINGIATELLKPALLRTPVTSHVGSGRAPAPRPQSSSPKASTQKSGFRRFVEILKMKG
jgi:MinD-like ATPase involved in chromosome partitioning or flagellar assembly